MIHSIAGQQDGVTNRRQLLASGVSSNQIDSRVRNRSLRKLYAGVYAAGHDRLTLQGRQRAALMAGGPNAVISHRTAANILGLLPPSGKLEVVRSSSPDPHRPPPPHASRSIHPGLVIHRTRSLASHEVVKRRGMPVTSAVRTIINLAERESPKTLDTAIRRGVSGRLLEIDELNRAVARCRGRKGITKLKKVLKLWNPAKLRSRSELENAVADAFRDQGIPPPLINDLRDGYEVDFQWPNSRVIVESDGGTYHLSRADRHRDYQKMLDLTAAGNIVCRIDAEMVFNSPSRMAASVRKLLEEEGSVELHPVSPHPVMVTDRGPP